MEGPGSAETTNAGYMAGCAFCEIAAGRQRDTQVLAETDTWLAFFPIEPATVGHTLIVPKMHVRDLWRTEPPLSDQLMSAAISVGQAIDRALTPPGMNLITSAGNAAEQTVFHLHLHLVPRWKGDNFDAIWPETGISDSGALESAAARIRNSLSSAGS